MHDDAYHIGRSICENASSPRNYQGCSDLSLKSDSVPEAHHFHFDSFLLIMYKERYLSTSHYYIKVAAHFGIICITVLTRLVPKFVRMVFFVGVFSIFRDVHVT